MLKIAQGLPHKVARNPATLRAAVFSLSAKNLSGGLQQPPLCTGSAQPNLHHTFSDNRFDV